MITINYNAVLARYEAIQDGKFIASVKVEYLADQGVPMEELERFLDCVRDLGAAHVDKGVEVPD